MMVPTQYKAEVHRNVLFLAPAPWFEILAMKLVKGGRCSALAATRPWEEQLGRPREAVHAGSKAAVPGRFSSAATTSVEHQVYHI